MAWADVANLSRGDEPGIGGRAGCTTGFDEYSCIHTSGAGRANYHETMWQAYTSAELSRCASRIYIVGPIRFIR